MALCIKKIIAEKGLSYHKIAKMMGLSPARIKAIAEKENITYRTMQKLADVLEVDVRSFICDEHYTGEPKKRTSTCQCPHCGNTIKYQLTLL